MPDAARRHRLDARDTRRGTDRCDGAGGREVCRAARVRREEQRLRDDRGGADRPHEHRPHAPAHRAARVPRGHGRREHQGQDLRRPRQARPCRAARRRRPARRRHRRLDRPGGAGQANQRHRTPACGGRTDLLRRRSDDLGAPARPRRQHRDRSGADVVDTAGRRHGGDRGGERRHRRAGARRPRERDRPARRPGRGDRAGRRSRLRDLPRDPADHGGADGDQGARHGCLAGRVRQ